MAATGGPDDVFPTPAWVVDRLLEAWRPRPGLLIEPAAGDGAIIRAVNDVLGPREWATIETRATCSSALFRLDGVSHVEIADFLSWNPTPGLDATAVITNPPFSLCTEFIARAALIFPGADLVFLVQLGFLASRRRFGLWKQLGTPDVYVLPNRPSFTRDGRVDQRDYAWIVLPGREKRSAGIFRVLAETPLAVRNPRTAWRRWPRGTMAMAKRDQGIRVPADGNTDAP